MFWLRYLLCAVIFSVAIYYLAPGVSKRLTEVADEIKEVASQNDSASQDDMVGDSESAYHPKQITTLKKPKDTGVSPSQSTSSLKPSTPKKEAVAQALPKAENETKRNNTSTEEVVSKVEVIDSLPKSPDSPIYSVDVIPPSAQNVISWAILCNDSAAFRETGKRIPAKAPGGHLVEISEGVHTTDGVEIARCKIWDGSKWFGPYLIRTSDLLMFKDGRDLVLASDVDNLLSYYRLNTRLVNRKAELDRINKSKNPYYARLRELSEKYNKSADRAKELVKIRDESQGAKRMKASEELRKLEIEQGRQKRELDKLVTLYNQWKQDNFRGEVDYDSDKEIISISEEMKALKPKVADFGVE